MNYYILTTTTNVIHELPEYVQLIPIYTRSEQIQIWRNTLNILDVCNNLCMPHHLRKIFIAPNLFIIYTILIRSVQEVNVEDMIIE
jgi:hypothetical protein